MRRQSPLVFVEGFFDVFDRDTKVLLLRLVLLVKLLLIVRALFVLDLHLCVGGEQIARLFSTDFKRIDQVVGLTR